MLLDNWEIKREIPIQDAVSALEELFLCTERELQKHESFLPAIYMPNRACRNVAEMSERIALKNSFLDIVKRSDHVLFCTEIQYRDSAGSSFEHLLEEEQNLSEAFSIFNDRILEIQQERYQKDKNTGTRIEALAASEHFHQRYKPPHLHVLYLAPAAEFSIMFSGYARYLEKHPLKLPGKEIEVI